jgi:GTPase
MSKEHLAIALALSVPVIVCITKVSFYPVDAGGNSLLTLKRLI